MDISAMVLSWFYEVGLVLVSHNAVPSATFSAVMFRRQSWPIVGEESEREMIFVLPAPESMSENDSDSDSGSDGFNSIQFDSIRAVM